MSIPNFIFSSTLSLLPSPQPFPSCIPWANVPPLPRVSKPQLRSLLYYRKKGCPRLSPTLLPHTLTTRTSGLGQTLPLILLHELLPWHSGWLSCFLQGASLTVAREICQMNKPAFVIFSNENFLQGRLASMPLQTSEAPGPAARLLHGCPVTHLLLYALTTNTKLHQAPRTYHHLCLPCAPCICCPSLGLPLTYLLEKPLVQKSTPRAPLGEAFAALAGRHSPSWPFSLPPIEHSLSVMACFHAHRSS